MQCSWIRHVAGLLGSLVLLLSGCATGEDAPAAVGVEPRCEWRSSRPGSTIPFYVAFVEKIFERNGLAVELTEGQDLPVFMAA